MVFWAWRSCLGVSASPNTQLCPLYLSGSSLCLLLSQSSLCPLLPLGPVLPISSPQPLIPVSYPSSQELSYWWFIPLWVFNIKEANLVPLGVHPGQTQPVHLLFSSRGQHHWVKVRAHSCVACVYTCVCANGDTHLFRGLKQISSWLKGQISDLCLAELLQIAVITMPHIHLLLMLLDISGFLQNPLLVSLFPKAQNPMESNLWCSLYC